MYHLSVLPAKQHKIQLIVSSQICIPNVSPNLTDAGQRSNENFQTWLITQVTAARGAACQFPSELPVCSVYNSQAAEQVIQVT